MARIVKKLVKPVVQTLSLTEKQTLDGLDKLAEGIASSSLLDHQQQTSLAQLYQYVAQDLTLQELQKLNAGWSEYNLSGEMSELHLAINTIKAAFPRQKTS